MKIHSNKVIVLSKLEEVDNLRKCYKFNSKALFLEINGAKICNWVNYITLMQKEFKFPSDCKNSVDRYLEWMRDLSWFGYEEYCLVIKNYSQFMKDDITLKNQITEDFKNEILPFWEDEVRFTVVNGKSKIFNVYIIG